MADGRTATGVHVPTFMWTVLAVLVALVVYHVMFHRG